MLDHRKLIVYARALELMDVVDEILAAAPAGIGKRREQLDNAVTSIVANIAEGAGEFSGPEKARFYRMARRSAVETCAHIEILCRRRQTTDELRLHADRLIIEVISMLVTLIK